MILIWRYGFFVECLLHGLPIGSLNQSWPQGVSNNLSPQSNYTYVWYYVIRTCARICLIHAMLSRHALSGMMRCELSAWHCPSHLDCIVSHCIVLYCLLQRCALYHIVLSVCSSDVLSVSHCIDCIVLYCIVSRIAYRIVALRTVQLVFSGYWLPWLKPQTTNAAL